MPDDTATHVPYEADFHDWALSQAQVLRAAGESARCGANDLAERVRPLDWDNLAEEVEALARRDRHELLSRVITIAEHLAKLHLSSATSPRIGWASMVDRERQMVADLMQASPSMRRFMPDVLGTAVPRAIQRAMLELARHGEHARSSRLDAPVAYTVDQILGDWLPPLPGPSRPPRTHKGRGNPK